jgi:hypothetical protein
MPHFKLEKCNEDAYGYMQTVVASSDSRGIGVAVQEVLRMVHEDLRIADSRMGRFRRSSATSAKTQSSRTLKSSSDIAGPGRRTRWKSISAILASENGQGDVAKFTSERKVNANTRNMNKDKSRFTILDTAECGADDGDANSQK